LDADWEQYQSAGDAALQEGDFAAAEVIWRAAYQKARSFKKYDPRVSITLEGLSEALWHQGKFNEAQILVQHTLAIFAKTRGIDHPDYGIVCKNLAMLYHFQGKYLEAEPLYRQSMTILTKDLSPDNPDVLAVRTNYADLLKLLGRQEEAEQLNSEMLTGGNLTRSGQYQSVEPSSVDNLQPEPAEQSPESTANINANNAADPWAQLRVEALRYAEMNALPAAENAWKQAIEMAQRFPVNDPRLPTSLEGLAEVYWKQGRFDLAEPLCRRCFNIYESVLGPEHADVGVITNNLAMLYHAMGKLQLAESMYRRSLPIRVLTLGAEHPAVFNLMMNYSNVLIALGRAVEAEEMKARFAGNSQGRWTRSGVDAAIDFEVSETLMESSADLPILGERK
jgi:tetratricopeptide (TPR) repeat protein